MSGIGDIPEFLVSGNIAEDVGIEIYIAAEKPEGVPEENWLLISREDLNLSPQMRIYVPDLKAYENCKPPIAEKLN